MPSLGEGQRPELPGTQPLFALLLEITLCSQDSSHALPFPGHYRYGVHRKKGNMEALRISRGAKVAPKQYAELVR